MTVSPRARRILAFTLFSASAGAFGSQGTRASKPHPNPNPRVPSPSLGSRNWQDCTLTAGNSPPRGPFSLSPPPAPSSPHSPAAKTLPLTPLHLAAPGRQPQTPHGGEASPSSEQLPGHAGAGRHLLGTTCRPARPGMPAAPR